jgi:hypothetical protein
MRCMYCGTELAPDARFCGNCGRLTETLSPAEGATGRSGSSSPGEVILEEQRRQQTPFTPLSAFSSGISQPDLNPNPPAVPPVPGTPLPGNLPTIASSSMETLPASSPAYTQFGSPSGYVQPGSMPSDPYAQPPTYYQQVPPTPPPPPRPQQGRRTPKVALIIVSVVVLVGLIGAGVAAYFLTRPQPVISVSSSYHVNGTPAGATGTSLHISGQKFSSSSAITFLLDGSPMPGSPSVQSDGSGNISASLAITGDWSVGRHTITARDASNYVTQTGVAVVIVQQGEANTPGPNGAPPDDASFKINITISGTLLGANQTFNQNEVDIVTGQPDPNGGTVCQSEDDGQPHSYHQSTVNSGAGYRETSTYSCSGTYKTGKLTYTETLLNDTIAFDGGGTCMLTSPQVDEQLTGSYTGNNTFTGTVTYPKITAYTCDSIGAYFYHYGAQGNWTGQVVNS